MKRKVITKILTITCILALGTASLAGCGKNDGTQDTDNVTTEESETPAEISVDEDDLSVDQIEKEEITEEAMTEPENVSAEPKSPEVISWNDSWEYASYSAIHTDGTMLYSASNGN